LQEKRAVMFFSPHPAKNDKKLRINKRANKKEKTKVI